MVLLQSEAYFIYSECWDCPIPLSQAIELLGIALLSLIIGIFLRQLRRTYFRALGVCAFAFTGAVIYSINHAGRNWGIIRIDAHNEIYSPNIVSLLCGILTMICIALTRKIHEEIKQKAPSCV